ncbi:MAG: SDR family NAD(P)-dependent oxidoreductase [bacterium]
MVDLDDKTALITGAARGIGQATAIELAQAGAHIFGMDLRLEDLQDTAELVQKVGRKFQGFACDITDESTTRKMVAEAQKFNTGFHVLVNNAGVLPSGPFVEQDFDIWRKTVEINLIGLMTVTHATLPYFLSKNQGHIVNIASIAGKFGTEGVAAYAASKHGVVGFSSALRAELRDTNIGVSWICPSMANTRIAEGVPDHFLTPLVQPEDVARAVRRAIETNAGEVFVPKRVRFVVSILPSLAPDLSRLILKWSKASQGWLKAQKEIEI